VRPLDGGAAHLDADEPVASAQLGDLRAGNRGLQRVGDVFDDTPSARARSCR